MRKFIVGIITVVLIAVVLCGVVYYTTVETVTIEVVSKERVTKGTGENMESKYMVFTETEVFENTDVLWFWKWNSSDVQGKLKANDTYNVKVVGWRVPFLSMYRNIIEIE